MKYFIQDIKDQEIESFTKIISSCNELEIVFPLESIGFTQSAVDIIQDYILVSYCSETIAPFIRIIDSEIEIRDKYYTDFRLKFVPIDIELLIENLVYFSNFFGDETDALDDLDRFSFYVELDEYANRVNKRIFAVPELINNYWANLINGAYWEIASGYSDSEDKFFKKTYRKYPEHKYGFWKNPLSVNFREVIYFSTENWIIPPQTNLINALKAYSGLEANIVLETADILEFKKSTVLVNSSTAIWFNKDAQLFQSIICSERVLSKKLLNQDLSIDSHSDNRQLQLFQDQSSRRKLRHKNPIFKENQINKDKLKYQLSEFGDLVVIEYNGFNHIFFTRDILSFNEIKELNEYLNPVYLKVQNLIGLSVQGRCNWNDLNDDSFEELCYDILYCHPQFDSSSIQKMGKSRSRDGGRDIVIKTKRTPSKEPELYVFQCKFVSDSMSLSASKISNAGNVIMQYGAKGYGVFTTTVIDATLYDMLDGFKRNMGIDTSIRWSKYELERYLNRYYLLKSKYFKPSSERCDVNNS
ncbi:MAG: hypothetical protein WC699_13175 [Bacteroidales bacterium]|jgi:hypothetical protein